MKIVVGIFSLLVVLGLVTGVSHIVTQNNKLDKTEEVEVDQLESKTAVPDGTSPQPEPKKRKKILKVTPNPDRVVVVSGSIGENASNIAQTINALNKESLEPIWVLINSGGGSVIDGAAVVSAIESSKAPVYTVCMVECASMAFIIHQYGTKRYAQDRAILMSHPASGGAMGEVDKMVSRLTTIQRYVDKFNAEIAARAKMDYNEFKLRSSNEMWFDAQDGMKLGFVDGLTSINLENTQYSDQLFNSDYGKTDNQILVSKVLNFIKLNLIGPKLDKMSDFKWAK